MNSGKTYVTGLTLILILAAMPAFAQTYTTSYQCTILSNTLSLGSRGNDVTTLQRFLVAQNYPGGGNWMVTGYYGAATAQAVRNFQSAAGIPLTGIVDMATRAAIHSGTCGGSYSNSYNYNYPIYPYSYQNYNHSYPFYNYTGCDYYNCSTQGNISISFLNPTAGGVGMSATLYGYGFTAEGNAVHFGNGVVANLRSIDGRTLSFTVPSELSGYGVYPIQLATYDVYVTNQYGQNSNKLPFTVTSLANTAIRPSITSVNGPNSLSAGTTGTWTITVTGSSNTYVTASVVWGDENLYNYATQAAQSIYLSGTQIFSFTHAYMTNGNYTPMFTVSNSGGSSQTSASVYVIGSANGVVALNALAPNQGQKGTLIALQGSGFSATDNVIHFGVGGLRTVYSSTNGTVIYYTIPQYVSPCDFIIGSCSASATQITPGTYPVYVTNSSGTSQTLYFTVVQ